MDFWDEIGRPKFVCAPMVDQSWLPFRRLVHDRGVQLSFTPMFHAKLLIEDDNYRDNIIKDLQDSPRPVITQLAANDVTYFSQATKILAPYCDAVDLNLGCPQHIARKGHYGAFLMTNEDDRNLIAAMIKAASQIHIITAKIRVFNSVPDTVAYAKLIATSGASILTVHGRTIDQKRDLTGLASWNHIKAVKEELKNVPIIANGNIRYFEDAERCLKETGADSVMSAEGLLSNPSLFKSPSIPFIGAESDQLIKLFLNNPGGGSLSSIKAHLFRIWAPGLCRHPVMRNRLDLISSMDDFSEWNSDMSRISGIQCEPYDRAKHKVSNDTKLILNEEKMTRNEKRRKLRYERKLEHLKKKKLEAKKLKLEQKSSQILDENHISKKIRLEKIKLKMDNLSRDQNPAICFDLGWSKSMNRKEISKLASQLARIHGANKKDSNSAKIFFTNFDPQSELYQECIRKHEGFEQFPIELTSKSHLEIFPKNELVILSPDSENVLESVELGTVYVIGGIVDETRKNKLTYDEAKRQGVRSARLPIKENLERNPESRGSLCTILSSNQVFEILLAQYELKDWEAALKRAVPPRKGFVVS